MKTKGIISIIGKIRRHANEQIVSSLMARGIDGISPSHGDILAILFQEHTVAMKVIAQRIDKKKNTVTVLVDKLIKLGYVQKEVSAIDNRISLISLSAKGEKLRPEFFEISDALIEKVYCGFDASEREVLITLLERVLLNLQRSP